MQVNIHPDFADKLLEIFRHTVEASDNGLSPEEDEQYSAFCESVRKAKRREHRKSIMSRARKAVEHRLHSDTATPSEAGEQS